MAIRLNVMIMSVGRLASRFRQSASLARPILADSYTGVVLPGKIGSRPRPLPFTGANQAWVYFAL